jgi:hypothetical protein
LREFEDIEISRQSCTGDREEQGEKLFRLLSGFRPRIRPQERIFARGFEECWDQSKGIDLQVVFKYCNCVEEEISWFSLPKSGHIRKQVFTKSVEFAKVECSSKAYTSL